jgi:nucleoside diphosphate kinase
MNKSTSKRLGAYLIKPDANCLGIADQMINDMQEAGLEIMYRKDVKVTPEQLSTLYPTQHQGEEYPSVIKLFDMGPATLVLVRLHNQIDIDNFTDIFEFLKIVRGKAREGGIRDKYLLFHKEDFIAQGLTGRELMDELAQNRIHAPDNNSELDILFNLFLQEEDIKAIKEYNEEIATEIEIRRSLSFGKERK